MVYGETQYPGDIMSNDELQEQFTRCEMWRNAEQWQLLAIAYYERGYFLNALCCFQKADVLLEQTKHNEVMA